MSGEELIEPEEGPERPVERFPAFGRDLTPTPDMIERGHVGNGAWDLTDPSIEAARIEIHEQKRQDKDARRKHFNESAKDALSDAVRLHHALIKRGLDVMERIEKPDEDKPVTSKDMSILALATKSAKELADRAVGRSSAAQQEQESSKSLLAIIQRKQ